MEDYKSPITIILNKLSTRLEDDIMKAILNYDITVDKEELIKAINYDRKQYEIGYHTGYQDGFSEARNFYKEYYLERIQELFKEKELDDGEE